MVAVGAGPQRSAFLSAFFTLVGCHGLHVAGGLCLLTVMMAQVAIKGCTTQRSSVVCSASHFLACPDTSGYGCLRWFISRDPFMTDTDYDRAPETATALPDVEQGTSSGVLCLLDRIGVWRWSSQPFRFGSPHIAAWSGGVSIGLTVLAIAQMGVHLVFFLHVTPVRTIPIT